MNIAVGLYLVIISIAFLFVLIGALPAITRTNNDKINEDKILKDIINRKDRR